MKKIYLVLLLSYFVFGLGKISIAQSVLDPNDPIVEYDSLNPPVQPPWGQIGKWVRTKSLSWNSDSYKCYIYEGSCFRLKFPKSYNPNANDGKKYPITLVFHGGGEAGPITDNENQLYHGGQNYMNADDNGTFDGYILFMQSQGFWGTTSYLRLIDIINYMVTNNKLDPFRISVNGLSSGGQASWDMVLNYPNYVSASLPMSNVSIGYKDPSVVNKVKFTPMWNFQGALDGSPSPSTAEQVRDAMVNAGGNYRYSEYANVGHNTWDSAFADPDFFPFMLRGYCSNPWVLFGRSGFCTGDPINLTVGVAPGFDGYQWRKNGVVISGATSNSINVTSLGTYDAKVLRGSTWSDWSHAPVVVQITPPTITPPITVAGLMSNVLIAADGKTYVNLQVPDNGYTSYTWKKVGSDSVIGNQRIYTATQPGQYIAAVTEKYGCSNVYSPPFIVADARGINAPDAATKLTAVTLSTTQILLSWENNPHPINNETFFEVYRSAGQDGNYSFVGKAPADTLTFKDSKLSPGTTYYYKIRAVNNNGAAPLSNVVSAITQPDNILPTPPGSVKVVYSTNSSIQLQWNSSTDDVGIENYQVYMNGVKTYSTTDTSIILNGLQQGSLYTFYIKSVDSSGNYSAQSNVVSSPAILKGLLFKYYEGYWLTVPNFNTLSPIILAGVSKNTDINYARRQTQFAFLWQGFLNVPADGSWRIGVKSDDGSLVWLNAYDPSVTPFINNDHTEAFKSKFASATLSKGLQPISIGYFQNKNGRGIQLSWANAAYFGDSLYHVIDDSFFTPTYIPADTTPKTPTNISATVLASNKIKITWSDKSNNETGFQLYRSLKAKSNYNIIYTTTANVTQYQDSGLSANTTYYYKVNAFNSYGTSAFTDSALTKTSKITAPKAPTAVKATPQSSSSINLTWNDVDTTETNYQVLRSELDSSNFKPVALLPANSTSYTDTALYGNTTYYYKVKALTAMSASPDKPSVKVKTKNNAPVINSKFSQKSVPYGVQTIVTVTAADQDGDSLTFSAIGLPSFASITNTKYNTANVVFNPSSSQQGNYQNIKIIAKDTLGGSDTDIFQLTVNNNFYPAMDSIKDYTLNEGDIVTIPLNATDQNVSDNLTWTISGPPQNYSLNNVSNGKANLVLSPTYGASGNYIIQVTVSDGNGGTTIRQFNVSVNDKDPSQTIDVRFKELDSMGLPWNDITGVNSANFKDYLNRTTTVGLSMQTTWWATGHEGPQTGNNSGIYPDPVLKDYYYFGNLGGPQTVTSKITGLDTSKFYNLSFYAGSNWSGSSNNGSTVFTIGAQAISLPVQNNTTKTADFATLKPASDGTISFTMSKDVNTPSGYINAIVIKSLYSDSSKPATPTYLVASNVPGKGVQLTWDDMAYNETAYKVFRAVNINGPYTIITTSVPFNSTSYIDSSASGSTQYYYFVRAANTLSQSTSFASDTVNIVTTDKVPVITPISSITLKNNQQTTINVVAKDDSADQITLTAENLPSFVTFTDNGSGKGTFTITPNTGVTGTFEDITVRATDLSDSSSSVAFNITVTDQNFNSVYVNFSTNTLLASSPWNNFTSWPNANTTLSNLYDDNNSLTSISLKLINGFQGNFAAGMQPGNNKGVYPEVVMRAGLYEGTTKTDSIQLSGLTKNKKYNFVFFNSHDDGFKGNTNFTINGQTVSLNATHNINTTASINGIVPDVNGQVIIKVAKAAGADDAYINSLIIQSYDSTLKLLAPSDLRIVNTTKQSAKLQWADRSFDETGFEIWRAADTTNPSYSLIKTVGANVTTYTDSSLSAAHTYYYSVRAINSGSQSAYCTPAAVTTYNQIVDVNFTYQSSANFPWNNTLALPESGIIWDNFMDDTGIPSSIGINETGVFAGLYGPGMNTGNNSGIYPDKVLADSYGLFTGESTTMKLTGLNFGKRYDLTFSASSQVVGDVNTYYSIGDKKVIFNASTNTDGAVTMYNVTPDANGEALITISPNTATSQYGLLGSLLVQEYASSTRPVPPPPSLHKKGITSMNATDQSLKQSVTLESKNKVLVHPNPFLNNFTLSVSLQKTEEVKIELYNINGSIIYQKDLGELLAGNHDFKITPGANISAGVYFIKVIYGNSKTTQYIKVLK